MAFTPPSDSVIELPNFTPPQDQAEEISPDTALGSFARGAKSKAAAGVGGLAGALAGAEAGAGVGAFFGPVGAGVGGVIGGIGGAMGGSALGSVFNRKMRGEEALAQEKSQLEANRLAGHGFATGIGETIPELLPAAAAPTRAAGVLGRVGSALEAGGILGGAGEASRQVDTGKFDPQALLTSPVESAIKFGPVGLIPHAEGILKSIGKAIPDAAVMTLSSNLYDHYVHGKPLDLKGYATETGESIPSFLMLNAISSVLHAPLKVDSKGKAEEVQSTETPVGTIAETPVEEPAQGPIPQKETIGAPFPEEAPKNTGIVAESRLRRDNALKAMSNDELDAAINDAAQFPQDSAWKEVFSGLQDEAVRRANQKITVRGQGEDGVPLEGAPAVDELPPVQGPLVPLRVGEGFQEPPTEAQLSAQAMEQGALPPDEQLRQSPQGAEALRTQLTEQAAPIGKKLSEEDLATRSAPGMEGYAIRHDDGTWTHVANGHDNGYPFGPEATASLEERFLQFNPDKALKATTPVPAGESPALPSVEPVGASSPSSAIPTLRTPKSPSQAIPVSKKGPSGKSVPSTPEEHATAVAEARQNLDKARQLYGNDPQLSRFIPALERTLKEAEAAQEAAKPTTTHKSVVTGKTEVIPKEINGEPNLVPETSAVAPKVIEQNKREAARKAREEKAQLAKEKYQAAKKARDEKAKAEKDAAKEKEAKAKEKKSQSTEAKKPSTTKSNAVQKQSSTRVLPREQKEAGKAGSERERVGQGKQGPEAPAKSKEKVTPKPDVQPSSKTPPPADTGTPKPAVQAKPEVPAKPGVEPTRGKPAAAQPKAKVEKAKPTPEEKKAKKAYEDAVDRLYDLESNLATKGETLRVLRKLNKEGLVTDMDLEEAVRISKDKDMQAEDILDAVTLVDPSAPKKGESKPVETTPEPEVSEPDAQKDKFKSLLSKEDFPTEESKEKAWEWTRGGKLTDLNDNQRRGALRANAGLEPDAPPEVVESKVVDWAKRKIKSSKKNVSMGLDPELAVAHAIRAADWIKTNGAKFLDWSKTMVKEFGEGIRRHLNSIWKSAKEAVGEGALKWMEKTGGIKYMSEDGVSDMVSSPPLEEASRQKELSRKAKVKLDAMTDVWNDTLSNSQKSVVNRVMDMPANARKAFLESGKTAIKSEGNIERALEYAELNDRNKLLGNDEVGNPTKLFADPFGFQLVKSSLVTAAREAGNLSSFTKKIVGQFGEWISQHAKNLWSAAARGAKAVGDYLKTMVETAKKTSEVGGGGGVGGGVKSRVQSTESSGRVQKVLEDAKDDTVKAVKNIGSSIKEFLQSTKRFHNIRDVRHHTEQTFDAIANKSGYESSHGEHAVRLAAHEAGLKPSDVVMEAATLVRQVRGDTGGKAGMISRVEKIIEKGLGKKLFKISKTPEEGLKLLKTQWDKLEKVAGAMKERTDISFNANRKAGGKAAYFEGYAKGDYVDPEDGKVVFDDKPPGAPGASYSRQKAFADYTEAVLAGREPTDMRADKLTQSAVRQMEQDTERRLWIKELGNTQMPDGSPIVKPMEDDGGIPKGYRGIVIGRGTVAVHEEMAPLIKALTEASMVPEALSKLAGFIRHNVLVFDSYHGFRIAQLQAAFEKRFPSFKKGLAVMEYPDKMLDSAVKHGLVTPEDAAWAKENRPKLEKLMAHGLNVSRISDALYKDAVPLLPFAKHVSKFIFDKQSRGVIAQGGIHALEKNRAAHPEWSEEKLHDYTAREVNAYYRNLGSQGLFKSKTFQDMARNLFIAPQWFEGMLRSEGRGYGQLAQAPFTGKLGNVGSAMAAGAVAYFAAAQVINMMTRGKPTWKNDEPDHKLDAWIPDSVQGSEGYFISPLSVFAEVTNDVIKYSGGKNEPEDVVAQIISNKLHPEARALKTFLGGKDFAGRPLHGMDRVMQSLRDAAPIPIIANVGGQKGGIERQGLSMFGIKADSAKSQIADVYSLAEDYKAEHGIKQFQSTEPSDYKGLQEALRDGDLDEARQEYRKLLTSKKAKDIDTYFRSLPSRAFTGSKEHDTGFIRSLTPGQRMILNRARAEQRRMAERFRVIRSAA